MTNLAQEDATADGPQTQSLLACRPHHLDFITKIVRSSVSVRRDLRLRLGLEKAATEPLCAQTRLMKNDVEKAGIGWSQVERFQLYCGRQEYTLHRKGVQTDW